MQTLLFPHRCLLVSTAPFLTIGWGQWSKLVLHIVKTMDLCLAESISVLTMSKRVTFLMLICFSICAVHFGRTWETGLMIVKCVFCFPYCYADDLIEKSPILGTDSGGVLLPVCSEWGQKIHLHGTWNMEVFTALLEMTVLPYLWCHPGHFLSQIRFSLTFPWLLNGIV